MRKLRVEFRGESLAKRKHLQYSKVELEEKHKNNNIGGNAMAVFDAKQFACSAQIVLVKLSGSVSSEFVRYAKYVEYFGSAFDIANVVCAC